MPKLENNKHEAFCLEYVKNGNNATEAYIKAGYTGTGAKQSGSRLLTQVDVSARVSELTTKKLDKAHLDIESMLNRLKIWLDSDITQTLTMTVEEIQEMPLEIRQLVSSYKKRTRKTGENETTEEIELKFINKERAYDMVNKHLGFYEKHNEQKTGEDFDYSKLTSEEIVQLNELRLKAKK